MNTNDRDLHFYGAENDLWNKEFRKLSRLKILFFQRNVNKIYLNFEDYVVVNEIYLEKINIINLLTFSPKKDFNF